MTYITNTNFGKAVRFIYDNIDQNITLKDVADSVGVSLSSLKRMFIEISGQSPGNFIRHFRMEFAFRSLNCKNESILSVALSAGFEDASAFSRSFKEIFGYPPREARKKLSIVNELENITLEEPEIVELNELHIQASTQQGLYFEAAPRAWGLLKEKLSSAELDDDFSGVFVAISHDNPHTGTVAENQVRFSAGVTHVKRDLGIEHIIIPAGVYAKFHYFGKAANLGLAYHYIFGQWAERSTQKINLARYPFRMSDEFPNGLIEQKIAIFVPLISK
ncbi:MAG: AraC family transcriptional regulator [Gammaproteobacteria bacterium]